MGFRLACLVGLLKIMREFAAVIGILLDKDQYAEGSVQACMVNSCKGTRKAPHWPKRAQLYHAKPRWT